MINSLVGKHVGAAISFLVNCPDPGGTLVLADGSEIKATRIPPGTDLRRVVEVRVDEPGDQAMVRLDCSRGIITGIRAAEFPYQAH